MSRDAGLVTRSKPLGATPQGKETFASIWGGGAKWSIYPSTMHMNILAILLPHRFPAKKWL